MTRTGRTTRAILLAGSLVFPACLYRSGVDKKIVSAPDRFANDKGKPAQAVKVGRWWTVFGDAHLDRLIQRAFAESLSLEQARARLQQSQAQLVAARSGWFPTITASGQAGRSKRIIQFPNPTGGDKITGGLESNTFNLSLAASYELDLFGKTHYAQKAAGYGIQAAEASLRAAYISLAAQISETYYLAVAARAQLSLLDQTITNREQQLELVQRRYREGVVTAVDVYQAQGNLAAARANRMSFVAQAKTAEHALALLVGRYPGQIDVGALDALPQRVRELTAGTPGQLLLQRPDLRAAHQRLLSTDAQVGAAFAAHFPSINLSASIGEQFDPTGFIWSVLGSLTAPLFQGGRINAEYKRQKAVLREQIAIFKATLLQAVREVEDALVNGRSQEQRVTHLEARAKSTDGALRLATEQYAQGLQGYLNVLSSEQSAYGARSELIAARRELISARIQLARALGGSWMEKEIERARRRDEQNSENETGS